MRGQVATFWACCLKTITNDVGGVTQRNLVGYRFSLDQALEKEVFFPKK